jgi:K+-sensing histidine kinase KdpD
MGTNKLNLEKLEDSDPVWRLHFDVLTSQPTVSFSLDVNSDVVLGRDEEADDLVDLTPYDAESLGVSRRHLMLRPEETKMFAIDLGSTNGTRRNGRSIGVRTPYGITDGDVLSLGNLQLGVTVAKHPRGLTPDDSQKEDLGEALPKLAKAITSQLKLDEVLRQALEMARSFTSAGETAIWLVDEETGELFLEAEQGIEDEHIKKLRLPASEDSLAGSVIASGETLRVSRQVEGKEIKIKTGYIVEALIYVPVKLGEVTFGVMAATHGKKGNEFSKQDARLLETIASFAAIAVQNSRAYEAADRALARRVAELAALNELSQVVSGSLDLKAVHDSLMEQLYKQSQIKSAGLWLVDEDMGTVVPFDKPKGKSDELVHETFNIGEGIVGKVVEGGEALVSEGVQVFTKLGEHDGNTGTLKFKAVSAACIPLRIDGKIIGALGIFGTPGTGVSEKDLSLVRSFAGPVAIAIKNARLFEQSERERATVRSIAAMLSQPFMIVNAQNELILSNEAADALWEKVRKQQDASAEGTAASGALRQLLEGLREGLGHPVQITLDDETYVVTVEHNTDVGTIMVLQDVSDVRKLERLRAEFAQALSHDIRGPLGSVTGYAHLLRNSRVSRKESNEYLDEILGASDRMLDMANQLLDFALLSDSPRAAHTECDLGLAVRDAISDLKGAALARSINIEHKVIGTPYKIQGDLARLYRSVLNLIDNALKYSPDKSKVWVDLTYEKEEVILKIRDSGPGVPEKDIPHIFEKYYRAKDASANMPGIGLGLAMVNAAITAHNGKVGVENLKDGGAEFTVKLPANL